MKINKAILVRFGLIVLLLALAFTNLYAFEIGDLRFSFYVVLGALFIIFISFLKGTVPSIKDSFPILIFLYILLSSLLNFQYFKGTSVIYSFLFIIYFIYLNFYSRKHLKVENFIRLSKLILIAFFVIVVVAQILVKFDLIELTSPIGFFQGTSKWGVELNYSTGAYRYFSLSSEPSYASIIVLLAFATLFNFTEKKKDAYIYALLTLYMLFSFKSAIGVIALFFYVLSLIKLKKKHLQYIFIASIIGLIVFSFTNLGGRSINRIGGIIQLLFTDFDDFIVNLNLLDSSAYARIGPSIIYLRQINLLDHHFYFGHGAATAEIYFSKIIYPESWNAHMVFNPPFLPGFLYDYGLFGVGLVLTFLWKLIKSKTIFYKVLVAMILLNANLNTQLFWYVIIMLTLSNYYIEHQYSKTISIPSFKNVFASKK